jgi:hypothetical protein
MFSTKLRAKYYFANSPNSTDSYSAYDKLISTGGKTQFTPPTASNQIELYLNKAENSIINLPLSNQCIHHYKPNHIHNTACNTELKTRKQIVYKNKIFRKLITQVIEGLLSDDSIIIKYADKNLGLCVIPREWYESQARTQLTDRSTYLSITSLPTISELFDKLRSSINTFTIAPQLSSFLYNTELSSESPHTTGITPANFYLLPKIHKLPISTRPIVPSMSTCIYNTSKYINYILQPVMRSYSRILLNTTDLLRHLSITKYPTDCLIFTADVTSLYPSICLEHGILKLRQAIDTYNNNHLNKIETDLIILLSTWVLKNNYISMGTNTYLQICGTAMGTPMAVVFANIYLAVLEDDTFKIFNNPQSINYKYDKLLLYVRFIDDIICITHNIEDRDLLLKLLNEQHPNIILTTNIDSTTQNYMDLTIYKGIYFYTTNLFDIKPYQKPMNAYLYIPPFSMHNNNMFKAFIQSEVRRYTINSTDTNSIDIFKSLLYKRLIARSYTPEFLDDIMQINYIRSDLLFPPDILSLYGTLHNRYHPRDAMFYPFNPPHNCNAHNDQIATPLIFKLQHDATFPRKLLRSALTYINTAILHDPSAYLVTNNRSHPLLCFTNGPSIAKSLIRAKYPHDIFKYYNPTQN